MKRINMLLVLAMSIASCASQSDKMQAEYFKDFQTQVVNLSQRIETVETKIMQTPALKGDMTERMDRIEERFGQIEASLNKIKSNPLIEGMETVKITAAPATSVISIRSDMVKNVEPLPKAVDSVSKTVETAREQPRPAASEPPKKERIEITVKEAPAVVSPVVQSKSATRQDKVTELYGKGYEMYEAGKHAQAVAIFRNFLQKYAADPLADNAQYWIAESYYAQKKFDKAIAEFKKVEKYHDRNKAPDAYLKIALAYLELGRKKEAGRWKKALLDKFKDSDAAQIAREKLSQ